MDKNLIEMERAHIQRGYRWAGLSFGERFVTIWGPHQVTFKKKLVEALKRRKMLSAFEMNDETMRRYVAQIRAYHPAIIEAYVSAAYGLAQHILSEATSIPDLRGVVTSAETLSEAHRATIERAFGCQVFNRYGSREFGTVAHECEEHAGLHVGSESFSLNSYPTTANRRVRVRGAG